MARRTISGKVREVFVGDAGPIPITYIEPMATVYRSVMRNLFRWDAVKQEMTPDVPAAIDALVPLAVQAIVNVEGVEVEFGGVRFKLNSDFKPKHYREVTGLTVGSWREVFAESYPDYVRAVAHRLFEKAETFAGGAELEGKAVEKNLERTPGESTPGVPTDATTGSDEKDAAS